MDRVEKNHDIVFTSTYSFKFDIYFKLKLTWNLNLSEFLLYSFLGSVVFSLPGWNNVPSYAPTALPLQLTIEKCEASDSHSDLGETMLCDSDARSFMIFF